MIRGGFLSAEDRRHLIALARDGSAASRLTRRANALVLLDDGWSCQEVAAALLLNDDTIADAIHFLSFPSEPKTFTGTFPRWAAPLLRFDAGLLDNRPPFLDLGLLKRGERRGRLLLARHNFLAEVGKPSAHP